MNKLPAVSIKTLIIQIITAIILCIGLAFYIWQHHIQQQLQKTLIDLQRYQSQLHIIEEQRQQYNKLHQQYTYAMNTKWKNMVFQWDGITFEELQHRIDTLYSDCNILLPEHLEIKKIQPKSDTQQVIATNDSMGYSIKLKISGQWLCDTSTQ